jgi:uncharacterized protein YbjT (DUF2867 family)
MVSIARTMSDPIDVLLFGASGMVGQGVLRECLRDPEVKRVLSIGRSAIGATHDKLREIVHANLFDLSPIEGELAGYDACFFCLGTSSAGLDESAYHRVTFDLTLHVAETLARLNPNMVFVYVSGAGTDSTEQGRSMWARVKGKTENAILRLPFRAKYMFRPGFIQPLHGVSSKTRLYRAIYAVLGPLYPVWRVLFPSIVTTTEQVGLAMLRAAKQGAEGPIVETPGINALAAANVR